MGRDVTQERQQAHDLLDALPAEKLTAVVHLLRAIGDPVAPNLANAPLDDEPISEEETSAAEASREWLKHHEPISHDKVLAELGLTPEDFERMGRTPPDAHSKR
jgi:hypothetical protein